MSSCREINSCTSSVEQLRVNIIKERNEYTKGLDRIIKLMSKPDPMLSKREATVKLGEQSTEEDLKVFKGGSLAVLIGSKVLKKSAIEQKKILRKEKMTIEAFKKDIGFDMEQENFTANQPVKFDLEASGKAKVDSKVQALNDVHDSSQFILDLSRQNATPMQGDGPSVRFEQTNAFAALNKPPALRSEADLKEIRRIVAELEVIKNSEYQFAHSDLSELLKSIQL